VLVAIVLTLAWGAFAFGANYWWASLPMAVAAASTGTVGAWRGWASRPSGVVYGLLFLIAMAAVQLVPLNRAWLAEVSPAAPAILQEYSIGFALTGEPHGLSIDSERTRDALILLVSLAALLVGCACWLSRENVKRLALALTVVGVVLAAAGIVQRATFNGKIYGFWIPLHAGASSFGPFINKNHFAGWMLMAVPVSLGCFCALVNRGLVDVRPTLRDRILWLSSRHASQAVLVGFAVLVMGLSLVLTMSRSGISAFALALALALWSAMRRSAGSSRRITVIYLLLLVVTIVGWVGLDRIIERFNEGETVTFGGRIPVWRDTLRIVSDFWLTGTGLNTYGVATLFYQSGVTPLHFEEAHNDYLQLAAEGGLLLAVPALATIVMFVREVRRRFTRESIGSGYWIRLGAVTGLVAVALQSVVDFSLQMPGNAALFAVLCGIALHRRDPVTPTGLPAPTADRLPGTGYA
jgi:O-antigen ligase